MIEMGDRSTSIVKVYFSIFKVDTRLFLGRMNWLRKRPLQRNDMAAIQKTKIDYQHQKLWMSLSKLQGSEQQQHRLVWQ